MFPFNDPLLYKKRGQTKEKFTFEKHIDIKRRGLFTHWGMGPYVYKINLQKYNRDLLILLRGDFSPVKVQNTPLETFKSYPWSCRPYSLIIEML